MRKFGIVAVLVAAFFVSACGTLQKLDPFRDTNSVLKYCELYELELNVLATLIEQRKLSRDGIEIADKSIAIIDPVCTAATPPSNQETLLLVKNNVEILIGLRKDAE